MAEDEGDVRRVEMAVDARLVLPAAEMDLRIASGHLFEPGEILRFVGACRTRHQQMHIGTIQRVNRLDQRFGPFERGQLATGEDDEVALRDAQFAPDCPARPRSVNLRAIFQVRPQRQHAHLVARDAIDLV